MTPPRSIRPVLMAALLGAGTIACSPVRPVFTPDAYAHIREAGISMRYRKDSFGGYTVKRAPRLTAQEIGTDIPFDVAPARTVVTLVDKRPLPALDKGPRYFLPTSSFLAFVPLHDESVSDYRKSYPRVSESLAALSVALERRTTVFALDAGVPDLSSVDAGQAIRCKVGYIDLPQLSGIAYLTQYTQEDGGNPVNNEELTYVFQGITKDRRYYIDARFPITHPSLPAGIDDAERITRDTEGQYLRKAEKDLETKSDDSFAPPITVLRDLIASIAIETPAASK